MSALRFNVMVSDAWKPIPAKEWEKVARRIVKAAKGRGKNRKAVVWVDIPRSCVDIDETGVIRTEIS